MATIPAAHYGSSQTIDYPDSDGQPIAEHSLQFQWIVTIKENLDALLPEAFKAIVAPIVNGKRGILRHR